MKDYNDIGLNDKLKPINSLTNKASDFEMALSFDITKDTRLVPFRKLGGVIARSAEATATGTLTFWAFDERLSDPANRTPNDNDRVTITVTPGNRGISFVKLLTSLSITSAIHESGINNTARDGTENQTLSTWSATALQWGRNATNEVLNAGLTFNEVWLPKNATITDAFLFFVASGTNSVTVNATIYGTSNGHAGVFSSTVRPSTVTRTTNSVTWNTTAQTDAVVLQSPDIALIIDEIRDLAAWEPGNRMQLQVADNASASGNNRTMFDYQNATTAQEPYLQINFTADLTMADLLLDFITNQDYSNSSDITGVKVFYAYMKNLARWADATNDNIRRHAISYTLTVRAYALETATT